MIRSGRLQNLQKHSGTISEVNHLDSYEDDLKVVLKMYKDYVNASNLETKLSLLPQIVESKGFDNFQFDVHDLVTFFQSLDRSRQLLRPEVTKLGKILLVLPATNAASERSFSAMKRVKTFSRSTTGDSRMNHLIVLHVHRDKTDAINLTDVANDFVGDNETRKEQ